MELPERVTLPFSLEEFPEIIDVRSPAEFEIDHIPGAINLPVLDDQERHEIGLLHAKNSYKARRLGATLITKNIHRHLDGSLKDHPNSHSPRSSIAGVAICGPTRWPSFFEPLVGDPEF